MLNANEKTYTLTVSIGGTSATRGRISKTSKDTSPEGDAEGTAITAAANLEWEFAVNNFDTYSHVANSHVYSTTVDFYFRAEGENKNAQSQNVADSQLSFVLNASGAITPEDAQNP